MKRHIATAIRAISETMPHVFEMQDDWVMWSGHDLILTPLADRVDDRDAMYKVWCPKLVAVDHRLQMKQAYRDSGWAGVLDYQKKVLLQCGLSLDEVNQLIHDKKQEIYN